MRIGLKPLDRLLRGVHRRCARQQCRPYLQDEFVNKTTSHSKQARIARVRAGAAVYQHDRRLDVARVGDFHGKISSTRHGT
ncbi:MAG: hypothetical protein A2V58_01260 [Candidatus Muproteobacteria bacterium RBG_19FT_COMBO_61_10]|uniref:Uncharacterized protein n=1 Tax=Candidatus Muproteobacteria bacterium RBG_19FT_COMBO_61_10 TaxID=1817761 RepID=A0A1F6UNL8_9PROT|nr:MAG: hypothetical protein A2V58_01260 [Candidatus Muproteobacteria bacterium RBG_19FT_COMBO_61_10]